MKWASIPIDELETIISFDYYEKTISLYTTRQATYRAMIKAGLKPTEIIYYKDKISGADFKLNMSDNNVRKMLSITNTIGQAYRR